MSKEEYKECYHATRGCSFMLEDKCDGHGLLKKIINVKLGGYTGPITELKHCSNYITRESQAWRIDWENMGNREDKNERN